MKDIPIKIDTELNQADLSAMNNNDIAENLNMIKKAADIVKDFESKLKEEAKNRLLDGGSIKGYDLVRRKTRKVNNIKKLFELLSCHNIDSDTFIDACTISLPKIEAAYCSINKELANSVVEDAENNGIVMDMEFKNLTKTHFKDKFKKITKNLIEEGTETVSIRKI